MSSGRVGDQFIFLIARSESTADGRHRSVALANHIADYLRGRGATVMVHYEALYRGALDIENSIERRGPCGCHLGPGYCQFADDEGGRYAPHWARKMAEIKAEVDRQFYNIWYPIRQRMGEWSARWSPPPAKPAPPDRAAPINPTPEGAAVPSAAKAPQRIALQTTS